MQEELDQKVMYIQMIVDTGDNRTGYCRNLRMTFFSMSCFSSGKYLAMVVGKWRCVRCNEREFWRQTEGAVHLKDENK